MTSLVIPTYITHRNIVNIALSIGDVDDKLLARGDDYYSSYFASILPMSDKTSFSLDLFTPNSVPFGTPTTLERANSYEFYQFSNDVLLSKVTLSTGTPTGDIDITMTNDGGVNYVGNETNDTYTFAQGVVYNFKSPLAAHPLEDYPETIITVETDFESYFPYEDVSGLRTYTLYVPKGTFDEDQKIKITFKKSADSTISSTMKYDLVVNATLPYKLRIFTNNKEVLSETIHVDLEKDETIVCALPTFLTDTELSKLPPQRYKTGDIVRFTLEPLVNTVNDRSHADGIFSVPPVKAVCLFDNVTYSTMKSSDLLYNAPTNKEHLSLTNLMLRFFDKNGREYPLLKYDDLTFSLRFIS
jgi:hypothetical protein